MRNVFFSYLRSRLKTLLIFLFFLLLFLFVYSLYHIPFDAAGYASFLAVIFGVVFLAYDFYRFSQKHKQLANQMNILRAGLSELPDVSSPLEKDYQDLVKALYEQTRELSSQMDSRLSEMTDYYTLWAHQIKTPIAAMRLLLQSGDFPQKKELEQQLFQIEQYVEMVLQYLRLESMSSDLELRTYDLDYIVRQAVKKYSVVFIHKKLAVSIKETGYKTITDEKWLTFVIEQLLSNALKYTREGGIEIRPDPCHPETLMISDTGIGIREEDLPRIFERGFTGYNGRMDKKSTGIGLFLCRRILQKLGHQISITSKIGEGTTVRLDFSREKLEKE